MLLMAGGCALLAGLRMVGAEAPRLAPVCRLGGEEHPAPPAPPPKQLRGAGVAGQLPQLLPTAKLVVLA